MADIESFPSKYSVSPGHGVLGHAGPSKRVNIELEISTSSVTAEESSTEKGDYDAQIEDYSIFSYFRSSTVHHNSENQNPIKWRYWIEKIFWWTLVVGFLLYFAAVIAIDSRVQNDAYWCSGDGLFFVLTTIVGITIIYYKIIKIYFGEFLLRVLLNPMERTFSFLWTNRWFRWAVSICIVGAIATFLIIDTAEERRRLQSLLGVFFIVGFGFIFSVAPRRVIWRHTLWGMGLQFIMALIVLRWPTGKNIFQCMADKVALFLSYTDAGSTFVFGPLVSCLGIFAFKVLPVTLFFSFCTSILYYYGILQNAVIKVGWLLGATVGTTSCESINAAGNIFLGMTEAPLLIRPYLSLMTVSEMHAVMAGGFATIAGSVMAAYINFGIDAAQLLTACIMNAPAALALSKLFYPELEKTRINQKTITDTKSQEINVLHAACVGVTNAIPLVANICANLIAFIAFIELFNNVFDWSCQLVDFDEGTCSLEGVFGYVFMPFAFTLGVEWSDCYEVGQLIGLKIVVNEFVAYSQLSQFIDEGILTSRSESIATFALCGFSNLSSIGIMMGGLGPLAPERKPDMARIVVRAMIAGSMATFLSASIAGLLLSESDYLSNTVEVTMSIASSYAFNSSYCPAIP